MMFFHDYILGFIADRYKSIPDEWQKVAAFRNIGWNIDLAEEHELALTAVNMPLEGNGYNEIPNEYREHDEAIQARIDAYREGFSTGFHATLSSIDAVASMASTLLGNNAVETGTKMKPLILTQLSVSVATLGEEQGLPDFMIQSAQMMLARAVEERVNAAFGLTMIETAFQQENEA